MIKNLIKRLFLFFILSLSSLEAYAACTVSASDLVVVLFRTRGSATIHPELDEFVQFYNQTNSDISVCTTDGSSGWSLVALDVTGTAEVVVATIPNGVVIPTGGSYLIANATAYSLITKPDLTYVGDIPDDTGIALYKTATPANFNAGNKLDAVGFNVLATGLAASYREGAGLSGLGTVGGSIAWFRRWNITDTLRVDGNDNVTDFYLLSTDAAIYNGIVSIRGSPVPSNSRDPIVYYYPSIIPLLDLSAGANSIPNRETFAANNSPNYIPGRTVLEFRKRVVNNTGKIITRFRVRWLKPNVVNMPGAGAAELRATNTPIRIATLTDLSKAIISGTLIDVGNQGTQGGGLNSVAEIILPPGGWMPGESLNFNHGLAIFTGGGFSLWGVAEVTFH